MAHIFSIRSYIYYLICCQFQSLIFTRKESKVRFHPSSILFNRSGPGSDNKSHQTSLQQLPTDWLIFDEMTRFDAFFFSLKGVQPLNPWSDSQAIFLCTLAVLAIYFYMSRLCRAATFLLLTPKHCSYICFNRWRC